jgi:hypothetical protein
MTAPRICVIGLATCSVLIGCGWRGPATIVLRDGSTIRCPNVFVARDFVSCEGLEGGEEVYPVDTVSRVISPNG